MIDKKELWVDFANAAVANYVVPDEIETTEGLVDDMIEVATGYADAMLEEYEERFAGGSGRRSGGKGRRERESKPE